MNKGMNTSNRRQEQKGVAILLSLLILLVLTLLGISSFHNAHIQERSAGNAVLQSVVFEAAAAGASDAINFFDAYKDMGADELCGTIDHEGWENPTDWVTMGSVGGATLKQRMYCLADEYPEEDPIAGRPARSQLFVLSRGEITSGGNVVAQRDVEVRLDIGGSGVPGDGCAAICFPSCNPGSFDFGTSNSFQVDGDGGPAITGGCQIMTNAVRNGIRNSRIGNFIGGVETSTVGAPWDSPDSVEAFRINVMNAAIAAQAAGTCMTYCYRASSAFENGSPQFGTVADPQITYINGSAYFGGNVTGAGIMFVKGNIAWNGTPQFQGLIVTLGGSFSVTGGGVGGDHGGSVVILNAPGGSPAAEFGPSSFSNTGAGNALYEFDCDALWLAHGQLDATGQGMWTPECNTGPESPYAAGPSELIIASWRENIGWREEFFGSD